MSVLFVIVGIGICLPVFLVGRGLSGYPCRGPSFLKRLKTKQKVFLRLFSPSGACGILRVIVQVGRANKPPLPGACIFEKTKNEAKSLFATIQPFGCLRHFESDRESGSRKQPSMADSALCAISGATTRFHDHSQKLGFNDRTLI